MSESSNPSAPKPSPFHSEMKPAPVLLTGATGFIGASIQRRLLDSGTSVRALVRPGSAHLDAVDPRCELFQCSLADTAALGKAVSKVSAVIYCAGSVRGKTLGDFLPANVDGVRNLVSALREQQLTAPFLLISSLAASRPELSNYARSKFLGEEALREQAAAPWTILRPPAVYGPGDTEMRPILKLARRGLVVRPGPRNQRVSLLYADDLASAVAAWLKSREQCAGKTYAIDDGHPGGYDWPSIVAAAGNARLREVGIPALVLGAIARLNYLAATLFAYAPMLSPGKVRELTQTDWLCDNTAFVQATGWQPQIGLPSGIRLSLEQH